MAYCYLDSAVAHFLLGVIFSIFSIVLILVFLLLRYGLSEPILANLNAKRAKPLQSYMEADVPKSVNKFHYSQVFNTSSLKDDQVSKKKEFIIKSGWLRITTVYQGEDASDKKSETLAEEAVNDKEKGVKKTMHSPIVNSKPGKDLKFVVLKYNSLFLYETETKEFCSGVASLEGCQIELIPETLRPGELYSKRYPIKIVNHNGTVFSRSNYCYVYANNAFDKEDWYLLFQEASKIGNTTDSLPSTIYSPKILNERYYFEKLTSDIRSPLLDQNSQWFNALFGRIFYNIHDSSELEQYFLEKYNRKTSKFKRPFFLGDIVVKDVHIGMGLPLISNAQCHSINDDGELNVSLDVLYKGGFKIQVETTAKFDIPKMKTIIIPLILAIHIKRLSGKVLIRIKPPPSDRLWFGFYQLPNMELQIEPIVSTKSVKWSIIHSVIEKRIQESLVEYMVLPNMDDIVLPSYFPKQPDVMSRPDLLKSSSIIHAEDGVKDLLFNYADKKEFYGISPKVDAMEELKRLSLLSEESRFTEIPVRPPLVLKRKVSKDTTGSTKAIYTRVPSSESIYTSSKNGLEVGNVSTKNLSSSEPILSTSKKDSDTILSKERSKSGLIKSSTESFSEDRVFFDTISQLNLKSSESLHTYHEPMDETNKLRRRTYHTSSLDEVPKDSRENSLTLSRITYEDKKLSLKPIAAGRNGFFKSLRSSMSTMYSNWRKEKRTQDHSHEDIHDGDVGSMISLKDAPHRGEVFADESLLNDELERSSYEELAVEQPFSHTETAEQPFTTAAAAIGRLEHSQIPEEPVMKGDSKETFDDFKSSNDRSFIEANASSGVAQFSENDNLSSSEKISEPLEDQKVECLHIESLAEYEAKSKSDTSISSSESLFPLIASQEKEEL